MALNPGDYALINMVLQTILLFGIIAGITYARKRNTRDHCKIISVAWLIQLFSIVLFMSPAMRATNYSAIGSVLGTEVLLHHGLGLLAFLLVPYLHLILSGKLKAIINLRSLMKVAAFSWTLSYLLGLHIFAMVA
ncbi:putative membrane protein [Methanohalophilus levihalophilus]|uniref:hypothetical protein n=1 Tax=Methanohalophilus levihalophilus TaxID=1431282 RepID=UPI001AE3A4FF|nr:hypothetical protein [Methanohalophilus levihalophilus]MBP2031313.1 putative membrane protein [Methanohalophilus levihalophilus]